MKLLVVLLSSFLAACVAGQEDDPATPNLRFVAGDRLGGGEHTLMSGERIIPGTIIEINTSWYGTCYEPDLTTDDDIPYPCDFQPYELSASCTGVGCPAPAPVNSDGSAATLEVTPIGPGPLSLVASMRNLRTQQTPSALRELEVVAPDAIVVHGFERQSPALPQPLSSVVSRAPIIRIDGQLRLLDEVLLFPSNQLTLNGRPVTIEARRSVFDLRAAFPEAIEANGDLRPGSYEVTLALADTSSTMTIRVFP